MSRETLVSDLLSFSQIKHLGFMMAARSAEIYLWKDPFGQTHYPLNVIEAQNWMGVRTDRLLELLVCSIRSHL
jgi:hypothetical protein